MCELAASIVVASELQATLDPTQTLAASLGASQELTATITEQTELLCSVFVEQTIDVLLWGCTVAEQGYIELKIGQYHEVVLIFSDDDGLIDLTDHEIFLQVRDGDAETDPLILDKYLTSGIELLDQGTDTGKARVTFESADLLAVSPQEYKFSAWARLPGGGGAKDIPGIDPSPFVVRSRVTVPHPAP